MGIVDGILVIPFLFHGEGVLPALFFGHVGKFGFFHKFFEIRVIPKQLGLLDEGRKILHHIQEPVLEGDTFFLGLVEAFDLHEGEAQGSAHLFVGTVLAQGEAVDELVWVGHAWVKVTEVEVEQAEEEDGLDVEVPFSSLGLVGDGQGRVEDGALHEVLLRGELDFDDEGAAVGGGAEEVIGGLALVFGEAELLAVADVDVDDVEAEDGVDGADDELFLAGFLENAFESVIDHGVDVLVNQWFHSSSPF